MQCLMLLLHLSNVISVCTGNPGTHPPMSVQAMHYVVANNSIKLNDANKCVPGVWALLFRVDFSSCYYTICFH